jgi:sterol 24-C-methyltransferase
MMAVTKVQLEAENHTRDAAFKKAMHGKTAEENAGFIAMLKKDKEAQSAAVDEYFKFWDGKGAGAETEQDMKVLHYRHHLDPGQFACRALH